MMRPGDTIERLHGDRDRGQGEPAPIAAPGRRRRATAVGYLVGFLVGISTRAIVELGGYRVAETRAQSVGWEVDTVSTRDADVYIRLEGPLPVPDTATLKALLDTAGVDTRKVTVHLVPIYSVKLANIVCPPEGY
ncbi:hypothetical protein [Cryobacterium sp. GrIS_2_6]|uniref:hypothetical protein n=1 Tax=Cryobacterium sp. GrIS_2_6 TaxID=3162785 RepID=UPI002E02D881|nr:hypothetical protein [Cryobacterium psychrotolerans]